MLMYGQVETINQIVNAWFAITFSEYLIVQSCQSMYLRFAKSYSSSVIFCVSFFQVLLALCQSSPSTYLSLVNHVWICYFVSVLVREAEAYVPNLTMTIL